MAHRFRKPGICIQNEQFWMKKWSAPISRTLHILTSLKETRSWSRMGGWTFRSRNKTRLWNGVKTKTTGVYQQRWGFDMIQPLRSGNWPVQSLGNFPGHKVLGKIILNTQWCNESDLFSCSMGSHQRQLGLHHIVQPSCGSNPKYIQCIQFHNTFNILSSGWERERAKDSELLSSG
jgi:hypothetical protein